MDPNADPDTTLSIRMRIRILPSLIVTAITQHSSTAAPLHHVFSMESSAILGVFIFIPRHPTSGHSKSTHSSANSNKASKIYSKDEVTLHNKRDDCWIIIKNKVYDVTSYVEEHPGGDAILAHAGDDSTEGFYGPQHATRVFDMIDDFYIGDLKQ
ncbi:cytochrome B5-like protein [Citrus sinensis]|uniref:Cytochrome B5-like protein n=1 Tax=Citrus sinensis TaxID=2711 RepID=A0ACB8NTI4_CITSI|nr:cytochrome B5-like protein [Citrus sinensis]